MPELPEVETVRRTLELSLIGKKIVGFKCLCQRIILGKDENHFAKIIGLQIQSINRKGKYLIFNLGEYSLVCHLRMEGKYFIKPTSSQLEKHEHVIFYLDDETDLRYADTRKFGTIEVFKTTDLFINKPLCKLGVEPNTEEFTLERIQTLVDSKQTIKALLLDQSVICGIGNIYANEICFLAKVLPNRIANTLNEVEVQALYKATNEVLAEAIRCGGTTIRSYTSSLGVTGRFQQKLAVHGKKGEPCSLCNTPIVKEIVAGRGTYLCPKCQK